MLVLLLLESQAAKITLIYFAAGGGVRLINYRHCSSLRERFELLFQRNNPAPLPALQSTWPCGYQI